MSLFPPPIVFYVAFALVIAWSALRYRGKGWTSGALLALLLLTLPLWILAMLRLYEWLR